MEAANDAAQVLLFVASRPASRQSEPVGIRGRPRSTHAHSVEANLIVSAGVAIKVRSVVAATRDGRSYDLSGVGFEVDSAERRAGRPALTDREAR
jgi:hypothetical protein